MARIPYQGVDAAAAAGLVDSRLFTLNSATGAFVPVTGNIEVFKGYFVRTFKDNVQVTVRAISSAGMISFPQAWLILARIGQACGKMTYVRCSLMKTTFFLIRCFNLFSVFFLLFLAGMPERNRKCVIIGTKGK